KLGLFVILAKAVGQFVISRQSRRTGQVRIQAGRLREDARTGFGKIGERRQQGALGFVQGVQHVGAPEERKRPILLRCSPNARITSDQGQASILASSRLPALRDRPALFMISAAFGAPAPAQKRIVRLLPGALPSRRKRTTLRLALPIRASEWPA